MHTHKHSRNKASRIAVGLAGLMVAATALQAAGEPAAGAGQGSEVLQAWLRSLQTRKDVSEADRLAIQDRAAEVRKAGSAYPLTTCLRTLYPDLTKALALLVDEKPKQALENLRPLQAHADPFLAAAAAYLAARARIQQENYEEAVGLLTALQEAPEPRCEQQAEVGFFLGLCHLQMLHRDESLAALTRFLEQFPNAPARDREEAQAIVAFLQRFEEESLAEITDLMRYSRRRLHLDDSGKDTQERQKRIVTILDKIIAKLEEQQQSSGGAGSGGSGPPGQKPSSIPGAPEGSKSGGVGASHSALSAGTPKMGALGRASRGSPQEDWGNLPKRDREEALSHIEAEFPSSYRELVEQYYKSLQEDE